MSTRTTTKSGSTRTHWFTVTYFESHAHVRIYPFIHDHPVPTTGAVVADYETAQQGAFKSARATIKRLTYEAAREQAASMNASHGGHYSYKVVARPQSYVVECYDATGQYLGAI